MEPLGKGKKQENQSQKKTDESRSDYDRLLLSIKTGDMDAFRILYEETAGKIYGYALSILKHKADAEEVMQDTFLAVWKQAVSYEAGGKPLAWMFTIARNLCYMRLRRQRVLGDVSLEELQEQESHWEPGTVCEAIELAPEKQALYSALATLREEERSLLLLHDAAGMRHAEIAEALKIPLSTVLSRYRRALKKLAGELNGENGKRMEK